MAIPKPCRSYEFTGDILAHDSEFKKFFRGLTEYLKSKLHRVEVKGKFSYEQYTCGQMHDRRNPVWKPWQHLWEYCEKVEFDPFAAKDAIEDRLDRTLVCECEILDEPTENRRKALANAFGADLGEPGRNYDFF